MPTRKEYGNKVRENSSKKCQNCNFEQKNKSFTFSPLPPQHSPAFLCCICIDQPICGTSAGAGMKGRPTSTLEGGRRAIRRWWQVHTSTDEWRCSATPTPFPAALGKGKTSRVMLKPWPRVEGRGAAAAGLKMTANVAILMKLMLMALSYAP